MKFSKAIAVITVGFFLGLAAAWMLRPGQKSGMNEIDSLRASLEEAQQAAAKAQLQRDAFKTESDQLRAAAEDVHRLRAEVSRLTRELTEAKAAQERSVQSAKKMEVLNELPAKAKSGVAGGAIAIESAPAAVQAALSRELGGGPIISGVLGSSVDRNGRMTYGFKGQTSDRRGVALRMADDGSILERSVEIPADNVPAHIQAKAAEVFDTLPIATAREIVDGENVTYELSAKGPESGMQAMVRQDGTILSYSARLRQPEQPNPKPNPKR